MKKEIKKLTLTVFLSLATFAFSPLGFCSGVPNNNRPPIAPNGLLTYTLLPDAKNISEQQYSLGSMKLSGVVKAPYATNLVRKKAFLNQKDITVLILPKIKKIDEYAFKGCKNLNTLILSENIECVSPKAFEGCNPQLAIFVDRFVYNIQQFLQIFGPKKENIPDYDYAVNSDEEILSFFNISKR